MSKTKRIKALKEFIELEKNVIAVAIIEAKKEIF